MQSLSSWLYRVSIGWITLVALVIFVVFIVLILPGQAGNSASDSTEAGSPDLSLIYSPADLYSMADAYGPTGRTGYIRIRFTFDLVWPLVYTFFLATATSWIFGHIFSPSDRGRMVNLLPLAGMLLDYLENIATSLVMLRFPAHTPIVDFMAPIFTFSKWLVLGASFILLLAGIVIVFWNWLRRR